MGKKNSPDDGEIAYIQIENPPLGARRTATRAAQTNCTNNIICTFFASFMPRDCRTMENRAMEYRRAPQRDR